MNYLGSDFNSSGSVMAKAELTLARTKRGECVTCGRKCYRKKLFKMIPLDDPGKVLNGRCLNCKPLQPRDVSMKSNTHSSVHNPSNRSNRSISNSTNSNSNNTKNEINRRMEMRKKKSHHQYRHHQYNHSSPHLWNSNSSKVLKIDGIEVSPRKGVPKSLSGRMNSTPPSSSSYFSSPSASRNRLNSTHSIISGITTDTALMTRLSIASSSPMTARKNTGSLSTLSIGSTSAAAAVVHCKGNGAGKGTSKGTSISASGRSLTITDSFGNSACESSITKSPDITWTPPPHHSEFGGSDKEINDRNDKQIFATNDDKFRTPSRLSSIRSTISTTSKHYPPTREDVEQAAFTLMAAQEHGLTAAGGRIYNDIFQELAPPDRNLNGHPCEKRGYGRDSPCSQVNKSIPVDNNKVQDNEYDDDMNSKSEDDESLNSLSIESDQTLDKKMKYSLPRGSIRNDDLEQHSTIIESNVSMNKPATATDEDDQIVSLPSYLQSQSQRKRGTLNRGGTFQPRYTHGHGRPGVGTHVFAGSTRTMSSMSSIGEEDHLLIHNSQDQKPSQIFDDRRIGSLSRNRQGSCKTLGSLSTIEAIDEEDNGRIKSAIDNLSASLSIDLSSDTIKAASLRLGEEVGSDEGVCNNKKETSYSDREGERWSQSLLTKGFHPKGESTGPQPSQGENIVGEGVFGNDNITSICCAEKLAFLRESFKSPEKCRTALEILSKHGSISSDEDEVDVCGFEVVVDCMKLHASTSDIELWGCRTIWNLSSTRGQVQNAFIEAGAPDVITQAMKRHIESGGELLEEAITALSTLATSPLSTTSLVGKGDDAVEAIVTAMVRYPGNAGIQTKGCEALATLAAHDDKTLRLRIMDKGTGDAIVFNAMALHTEDSFLQKWSLLAVRNLCRDCEENQIKFLELGVVDPVLTAMKKHRNIVELQEFGAGTISILAGNHVEAKKVIEENGGIGLILRAIMDHSKVSKARDCYIRALMTLALDSYNKNNFESRMSKVSIKASEVINAVFNAVDAPHEGTNPQKIALAIESVILTMETHEENPAVQEIGCAVLFSLADLVGEGIANNADQTKMDIVDEGALDVINMAMVLHKHDARVQERACALLSCLAIEENYAAIMAAIGPQLLQDAAKVFPSRRQDLGNRLIQLLDEYQNEDNNQG